MKMTKKLLLAAAVMFVASFGFMSCGDDDDPYGMINGGGNNYTINHENTDSFTHRGYETTALDHEGELLRFTFDAPKTDSGVLGFVWDLKTEKTKDETGTTTKKRTFLLFGLQLNNDSQGTKERANPTLKYYVSKYYHVEDIQAYNFGAADQSTYTVTSNYKVSSNDAGEEADHPVEYEFETPKVVSTTNLTDSDGKYVIWADIYPVRGTSHEPGKLGSGAFTGEYGIQLYAATEDGSIDTENAIFTDPVIISTQLTGYDSVEPDQADIGVYANTYPNSGQWCMVSEI